VSGVPDIPRTGIAFVKAHGAGNDFLVVDQPLGALDRGELARRMCDRHGGVGADGMVVLEAGGAADGLFRIYNSDGSEATLSGNGLRCAAAHLLAKRPSCGSAVASGMRVALETRVGLRELFFLERRGREWWFRAEMGRPSFAAAEVPFIPPGKPAEPMVGIALPVGDAQVRATILSTGNAQCIVLVEDWTTVDWRGLGAELERHPWFPDRANIGFVRVLSEGEVEARFWERGAGPTLASGSGSCACAVAAHLNGKTGRRVRVRLERGAMDVDWRDDGIVDLTGPAEIVCEGVFHFD
jgi:diaminopimelate epimerase